MAWGKKKKQEYSYFGTNVTLEGRVCFTGVIRLDGRVNGDIVSSGSLIIEETAVVTGNILVESLVLTGTVYGNITAYKYAQLHRLSKVYGHISYGELSFEGALHEGSSHKLTSEEIESAHHKCVEMMAEAASGAAYSKPDEIALEQFSSSVADNAEQQANVLLRNKLEIATLRKSRRPNGTQSQIMLDAPDGGDMEAEAVKAEAASEMLASLSEVAAQPLVPAPEAALKAVPAPALKAVPAPAPKAVPAPAPKAVPAPAPRAVPAPAPRAVPAPAPRAVPAPAPRAVPAPAPKATAAPAKVPAKNTNGVK